MYTIDFAYVCISLIVSSAESAPRHQHFKTKHYSGTVSASVTRLTRMKAESVLTCSFHCSVLEHCSGFSYSKKLLSCNLFEKTVGGTTTSKHVYLKTDNRATSPGGPSVEISPTLKPEKRRCGKPRTQSINITGEYKELGKEVEYACADGYTLCGLKKKTKITCKPDGQWSQPTSSCHRYAWHDFVKGKPNDVIITCPIQNSAVIYIVGEIENFEDEMIVRINVSGKGIILSHTFWPKKTKAAGFELRYKSNASKWKAKYHYTSLFKMKENTTIHFKIEVYRKSVSFLIDGKPCSRYAARDRLNLDKVSVGSEFYIQNIHMTYRFPRARR